MSKPSLYRAFGSEDDLTLAASKDYADSVLAGVSAILGGHAGFSEALEALIMFVTRDPVFDRRCLYVKVRAARRQFGPQTQAQTAEIEAESLAAFLDFLQGGLDSGSRTSDVPVELAARYLDEQVGLALTQRSTDEDPQTIEAMLRIAIRQFQS